MKDRKRPNHPIHEVIRHMTVGETKCVIRNQFGEPLCYIEKSTARKMGFLGQDEKEQPYF